MIRNIQAWTDDELAFAILEINEAMGWCPTGPWLAGVEYLRALEAERERRGYETTPLLHN